MQQHGSRCGQRYNKKETSNAGPLADSHEIKVFFYKGYFRQNKGCFIEILTKIKSKLTSNFLAFTSNFLTFLSDPDL